MQRLCDRELGDVDPRVGDAIRYALLGEGKRLRALLTIGAYRAGGGTRDPIDLAASVEVVHAYSLVHDDLPCMDDDAVRRGRPAVHRAFGVQVATAAGLAMVPMAARAAFRASRALGLTVVDSGQIVRVLMQASGAGGMIGGQLLDLEAEGRQLSLEELEQVHRAKTGALIAASVRIGAMAAGAGESSVTALQQFGDALGLAFQIADDVLDVTSTTDQLGKTAGRDRALGKSTYPGILGVDGAVERARSLAYRACERLERSNLLTNALRTLAHHVVERQS
ncbi:MAG: Farnesyl diphosphate synthase [Gemmatimonadaceae bacterium]|nr:Farnesyl diphosphate synthase [Gemmatimonadaceae bacterium]